MKKARIIVVIAMMIYVLTGCGTETPVKEEQGMDPHGTYDENDLMINDMEIDLSGITVRIPKIDGLKDSEVQARINEDMQSRILQACEEVSNLNYLEYNTNANFANVISISVYYGSDEEYGQVYLNYNLVDGEKLAFEDLFFEDTDTLEIVRNAFYEALILSQMSGNISENEYYKIVKSFTESDDKQFAFTPAKIYMYQNENTASVRMLDISKDVSIYSRYLTEETLYEKSDIGRDALFTGVSIPEDAFELIDFGYLHDNCWYDISIIKEYIGETISTDSLAQYKLFKNEKYEEFYETINQYGKKAKENPDKFYIILSKPSFYLEMDSVWNGEEWLENYQDTVVVTENFTVYDMPMKLYEDIYREKIVEAYRYDYLAMSGGIYLDVTEDDVQTAEQYYQKTYNYMTGEEVD